MKVILKRGHNKSTINVPILVWYSLLRTLLVDWPVQGNKMNPQSTNLGTKNDEWDLKFLWLWKLLKYSRVMSIVSWLKVSDVSGATSIHNIKIRPWDGGTNGPWNVGLFNQVTGYKPEKILLRLMKSHLYAPPALSPESETHWTNWLEHILVLGPVRAW
jgi:hypothetical protein